MAPGDTMIGRRIPHKDHEFPALELPGDYAGPIMGYTGGSPAVFFLKPNSRDADAPPGARSVQHVCSPPHVFTEMPDGSLQIRESISDRKRHQDPGTPGDGWHGYLDAGHAWRQV